MVRFLRLKVAILSFWSIVSVSREGKPSQIFRVRGRGGGRIPMPTKTHAWLECDFTVYFEKIMQSESDYKLYFRFAKLKICPTNN